MSRFLLNGQDLYGNAPQTGDKVSVVDTEGIVGQAGSTTNSQALFDGIAGDLGEVKTDLSDYHVVPSKNKIKIKAQTQTVGDATYTVDDLGVLTLSGNVSSASWANIGSWTLPAGNYIANGVTGGSVTTYYCDLYVNGSLFQRLTNGDVSFTLNSETTITFWVNARSGNVTGVKMYLMIRDANETDGTFEPYFLPMRDGKLDITDEQVLGAWNVLSVPSSVVTQTNNGVTFTITRDSSGQVTEVDANGTAGTGGSRFTFTSDNIIRKGRYYAKNGTGYSINYQENGVVNHSGNTDDFVVDWTQDIACRIVWDIAATVQVNHVKFYPQLALKPNLPFSPYAMTNAELTTPKSGTCTATITSNNATLQSANYVLIGRVLWAYIKVKLSSALATSGRVIITLSGLPQNNALGTSIFVPCFGAPSVIAWFGSPNPNNVIIQNNGAEIAANTEIQLSGCIPV